MRLIKTTLGILLILVCLPGHTQNMDSLRQLIATNTEKDSVPYWEEQIGNRFFNTNLDSARHHYFKAIPFYKTAGEDLFLASILKRIAISYAIQGKQDSAIYYMTESLDRYKVINDSLQMAFSHNNLGLMQADNGNYPASMEHLLEAHRLKNSLVEKYPGEKLDLAGTELNIGITYHYIEDYENAKRYYILARESYAAQKDSFGMLNSELQQANLLYDLEDYPSANAIYTNLLDQSLVSSNPFAYNKLLNNYATLLFTIENYEKAKTILEEAYQSNLDTGNARSAAKNLNNLAEISFLEKSYDKALEYGETSLRLCKENKLDYSREVILKILAETYEKKGDFLRALELQKQKEMLSDSLYNSENNRLLTEMETRYQSAQKEKEIALKTMEIDRVNKSRIWFMALSLLLIIFSIIFFVLYRDRRKKNRLLKQSLHTKDKLISIIAHDLKNPAIAQKMAIQNLLHYIDHLKKEDIQPQLQALYQSSESQVSLLHNLLNWAHSQTGRIEYQPVYFQIGTLIQKNIELFHTTASNKNINIEVKGEKDSVVFADKPSIDTVLRNLISNAIKFSHRGKSISLLVEKREDNTLLCSIADQGIGISKDKINKLFDVNRRDLGRGTEGEQGSGLGLILCKELVEKNRGNLTIKSEEGQGSILSFSLPLSNPKDK